VSVIYTYRYTVSKWRPRPPLDVPEEAYEPLWTKEGTISATSRDEALEGVLRRFNLTWEDVDEVEEAFGGRPDNYLLAIIYKGGRGWGEVHLTGPR